MEESQVSVNYDFSQPDMPAAKRQRRGSKNVRRPTGKMLVPRSIRTRGTPEGYYEIPVRQLIKLYCNTSSGLFATDQVTGAPDLVLGGNRGFGISFAQDLTYFTLGEGTIATTVAVTVPGFSEMQQVFDLCKIVDCKLDYWWTGQEHEISPTAGIYGGFDMYTCVDPNSSDPPGSLGTVLQYSKVKRHAADQRGRSTDYLKPMLRGVVASDPYDAGTTATIAVAQPSTYLQTTKPAPVLLGIRGWLDIPTAATSRLNTLNIMVTQTRRFKTSK